MRLSQLTYIPSNRCSAWRWQTRHHNSDHVACRYNIYYLVLCRNSLLLPGLEVPVTCQIQVCPFIRNPKCNREKKKKPSKIKVEHLPNPPNPKTIEKSNLIHHQPQLISRHALQSPSSILERHTVPPHPWAHPTASFPNPRQFHGMGHSVPEAGTDCGFGGYWDHSNGPTSIT